MGSEMCIRDRSLGGDTRLYHVLKNYRHDLKVERTEEYECDI